MNIEYLIFWALGYFFCYLSFYIRSKKDLLKNENYPRSITVFVIIILFLIICRYLLFLYKGI